MAAAVPSDLQAFHERRHLLCAQRAVPSRNGFAFSRDPKAGSSWQLPTQEAENSENTYFSHEIKSAPFLSLTHIHNSATDGRAESSGLRAGIASSSATGACRTAQTNLFLSLPPAPVCGTDTAINIHTGGWHRGICS